MPLSAPSFLAHQGVQAPVLLRDFLGTIQRDEPSWRVGATVFLPRYAPATSTEMLAELRSRTVYTIGDPETHRLSEPFEERGRGRHHLAYLRESDPRGNRRRFGDLIDDLVDLPEGHFYLRVQVTPPTSFGQYANRRVLIGMRDLVRALADNGRRTFLPQMGLAGWLLVPSGALAFGSGMSASLQRFVAPTSGFGRPLEWYFLPQFLGFVLRSEVPDIAALDSYEPCECPYCVGLRFGLVGVWDREAAGLHYMWWCALLANELAIAQDLDAALRGRLEAARLFWNETQQGGVVLDERSEPRHLAVWTAVAT
jgi:hypothetical protein